MALSSLSCFQGGLRSWKVQAPLFQTQSKTDPQMPQITLETLDFKQPVIHFILGFGLALPNTHTQLIVHRAQNCVPNLIGQSTAPLERDRGRMFICAPPRLSQGRKTFPLLKSKTSPLAQNVLKSLVLLRKRLSVTVQCSYWK